MFFLEIQVIVKCRFLLGQSLGPPATLFTMATLLAVATLLTVGKNIFLRNIFDQISSLFYRNSCFLKTLARNVCPNDKSRLPSKLSPPPSVVSPVLRAKLLTLASNKHFNIKSPRPHSHSSIEGPSSIYVCD